MGKSDVRVDTSLLNTKDALAARVVAEANEKSGVVNEKAFDDITDLKNEDFIYVL